MTWENDYESDQDENCSWQILRNNRRTGKDNECCSPASERFRKVLGLSEIEPKRIQCFSVSEKAMVQ